MRSFAFSSGRSGSDRLCFLRRQRQAQGPATAPPAQPDMLSSLPKPPDEPRSLFSPAVAEGPPRAIVPDHYFEEDPLLDLPQLPAIGWFAGAEASLVGPHVKNELKNMVPFAGRPVPDKIALQSANLDWTVSPRFEVGYRLPSGFGEFPWATAFSLRRARNHRSRCLARPRFRAGSISTPSISTTRVAKSPWAKTGS